MSTAAPMRETTLAAVVVEWLRSEGWRVCEEVAVGSAVADIIALRDLPGRELPLIRWIECKTTFSLDLAAQAVDAALSMNSHTVEVAVPAPKRGRSRGAHLLEDVMRQHGIGILYVSAAPNDWTPPVQVHRPATLRRRILNPRRAGWLAGLRWTAERLAKHENLVPAGTNRGGFWTPYKGTMAGVRRLIERRGEVTIADIMAEVKHHYSKDATARACIVANLQRFESDWCATEERDGRLYFRLVEPSPTRGAA